MNPPGTQGLDGSGTGLAKRSQSQESAEQSAPIFQPPRPLACSFQNMQDPSWLTPQVATTILSPGNWKLEPRGQTIQSAEAGQIVWSEQRAGPRQKREQRDTDEREGGREVAKVLFDSTGGSASPLKAHTFFGWQRGSPCSRPWGHSVVTSVPSAHLTPRASHRNVSWPPRQ